MVVDLQRLGKRPIPQSFFDLSSPIYKNEICIIGTKDIPDPMLALNFYYGKGEEEMNAFIENLALLAPPVYAIRHIGKSSNKYGSIFVMPLLFANVCKEIKNAKVIMPKEGFFAEPFILFSKNPDEEKTKLIIDFFNSKEFSKVISEKYFIPESKKSHSLIYKECLKTFFPEVSKIYPLLRKKLSGVPHQNLRS